MKDTVDAAHRGLHGNGVGDIPFQEVYLRRPSGQIAAVPGRQIVKNPHAVAAPDECLDDM